MSRILTTPKDWPEIDHPRCQNCGLEMWLIRIAPQSANREARTYGCAACDSFGAGDAVDAREQVAPRS